MLKTDEKFLTFLLGEEIYALSIQNVKEIISLIEITPVPKMPSFIKGVINLRGKIIPVIDLRIKFSLKQKEYDEKTCIIISETSQDSTLRQIGIIVDLATEVLAINQNNISSTPKFYDGQDIPFISGVGNVKENVVWILNLEKIVSTDEIILINKIKKEI